MSSGRLAPRISSNALRVLEKRYLRKNIKGMITETPEELFSRVASDIARAERRYGDNENNLIFCRIRRH